MTSSNDISFETALETSDTAQVAAAFQGVEMDFRGSARAWRYGGGRDLSRLVEEARATRIPQQRT